MSNMVMIVLCVIGCLVAGIIGFLGFSYSYMRKRSASLSYKKRVKSVPRGRYLRLYSLYANFPLTKRGIARLHRDISALSVFTFVESKMLAAKLYTHSLYLLVGITIANLLLFSNLVYVIIVFFFAVVARENFVYKRVSKFHFALLKDELEMLSSLRQEYMRTGMVIDAYAGCTCGKYVAHAVKEIRDSLEAIDAEAKLDAFSASTPLPTLQTLAFISHIINNKGDSKTSDGSSVFASAIDMIADEVRMSIRRETLQRQMFGTLEYVPVVPIIGVAPLSMVFKTLLPGTAVIYDGGLGFVFTLAVLGVSLLGYYVVTNATKMGASQLDDRTALDKKLMKHKNVRKFVARIKPRNRLVLNSKFHLLHKSLTRNTMDYLYLRKTYMCVGAFVLSLILAVLYLSIGYNATMTNVSSGVALGGASLSEEEKKILQSLDKKFFAKFEEKPTEEEFIAFLKENMPSARTPEIESQMQRLSSKYDQAKSVFFEWWMVWLCFAIAAVAYNLPEYVMKKRAKLMESESEEDCLQLQTTIAIMMNTNMDAFDLLEYMYKNSRVFKNVLADCYLNYASDPHLALRIAKSKTESVEFRTMIDKLSLTILQITIADAFANLASERAHMLRMREAAQIHSLTTKRGLVRPFALAPLVALMALQFIFPICLLAYSMFAEMEASGLLNF